MAHRPAQRRRARLTPPHMDSPSHLPNSTNPAMITGTHGDLTAPLPLSRQARFPLGRGTSHPPATDGPHPRPAQSPPKTQQKGTTTQEGQLDHPECLRRSRDPHAHSCTTGHHSILLPPSRRLKLHWPYSLAGNTLRPDHRSSQTSSIPSLNHTANCEQPVCSRNLTTRLWITDRPRRKPIPS